MLFRFPGLGFPVISCTMRRLAATLYVITLTFSTCFDVAIAEDISLHETIDQLIARSASDFDERVSPITTDEEFLRRIYLDLTGRIPSTEQARSFLRDDASEKRAELIDRLLETPQHARHMQHLFDVMLMNRRNKLAEWHDYLFRSFWENKSWDQLTRELLSSDGTTPENRPAAHFLLARELNPTETTRDIGRLFLGRDLECAQCHDHPHIKDYLQRHFYGISAFLNRSYLFVDPDGKKMIGEKADGIVNFVSAFTGEENEISPRILDAPEILDPSLEEEPYEAKPDKQTRGIPKYSRRLLLASAMLDTQSSEFRRNIANRLWAWLIGRGLVEPVDMFHEANPPSHPELLELLGDDLFGHGYNMLNTIRQITLSQTYQRSSQQTSDVELSPAQCYTARLKPLTPEQLAWSTMQGTGVLDATRAKTIERLQQEDAELADAPDYPERLERAINEQLQEHVQVFVETFASNSNSVKLNSTASHALFLMNSPLLAEWLQPSAHNLVDRLQQLEDTQSIAEEMYICLLTRAPAESEVASVGAFLEAYGDDKTAGIQELARAIICSAEFRFNH